MARATRIVRQKHRRQRRGKGSSKIIRRLLVVAVLVTVVGISLLLITGTVGAVITYVRYTRDLPEFSKLTNQWDQELSSVETSTIYAWRDEEQTTAVPIYEMSHPLGETPGWSTLDQFPIHLIEATVAAEDPHFWEDQELDAVAILQSLIQTARLGESGAIPAVITMKVLRQNVLGLEQAVIDDGPMLIRLRQRLKELLLTHRASSSYSQEQILEWYLNTAAYGKFAFGAEAAARVYFNKSAAELSVAEAAMIAALPQAPEFNPVDAPEQAKVRQELVLDGMAASGAISREAAAAAKFAPVAKAPDLEERFDIIAPHFALYVRRELEALFPTETLLKGGLHVYTSLDLEIQQQAECVARVHVGSLSGQFGAELPADERSSCLALAHLQQVPSANLGIDHDVNNAAVIMLDAETAAIKAMVGSLNFWDNDANGSLNLAVDVQHQPGSALWPFIYLTALSQGYTAATMVLDIETSFENRVTEEIFRPQNDDGIFRGPLRLREAMGSGYTVPATQVMSWVGTDKVLRTSHSLGITGLDNSSGVYGLSLAVGGGEVTLLDMVYAYNVMNNMGVMLGQPRVESSQRQGQRGLDPVAIVRVEDRDGEVLYEHDRSQRREILTPQLAYLMNDMLSDRSARCGGFGCPNGMELPDNRPAAVSTGSTNDYRDAWTIGYTPQLVAGVWVGNSDDRATSQLSGIKGAAPIWQALMSWAMEDEPVAVWTRPPDLTEIAVCNLSGLLSTAYCPTYSEMFIAGTQPTVYDSIYQEYAINRETERLATIYTPPELVEHKIFKIFPEQLADWAAENGIEAPPTEFDTIGVTTTRDGDADILSPRPFSSVKGNVEIIGTAAGDDFDTYRLAYFDGLTPANLQVIADQVSESKENESLGSWDVANLDGLHTLLLTVVNRDGSFTDVTVPLSVDNTPPSISILSPLPNQQIPSDARRISLRVEAADNTGIAQVEYYLNDERLPFATSNSAPFTVQWTAEEPGCYDIVAVAIDKATNETRSASVPICLVDNE